MNSNKISEQEITTYLLDKAELDSFFINCSPGIEGGLIGYVDRKGVAWTLMEDDDDLVEICISFLKKRDTPVFSDSLSEDAHVERLQTKLRQGD